jgi:hypothetical protein
MTKAPRFSAVSNPTTTNIAVILGDICDLRSRDRAGKRGAPRRDERLKNVLAGMSRA